MRALVLLSATLAVALAASVATSAPAGSMTPTRTFHTLTSANGRLAVVCDDASWAIHSLHEHIYQNVSETEKTRIVAWVRDGQTAPAVQPVSAAPREADYLPGTGIIRHAGEWQNGVEREQFVFAPFGAPGDSARADVLVLLRLRNRGASVAKLKPADGARTLPGPDIDGHGEWDLPATLAAGDSLWRGIRLRIAPGDGAAHAERERLPADAARAAFETECANWEAWHAVETLPAGLSTARAALYRQSTAMLRMSQCTESGAAHGQIVASLPPGQWNITWVRDACYAIAGLVASGHHAEARDALDFFRHAQAGRYRDVYFSGRNFGVDEDYGISVCRYFGNGVEESDRNSAGPNVELDGFGLYPWAAWLYASASGDTAWAHDAYPWISAHVLRIIPMEMDHQLDVMREDSSIWERHIGPPNGPEFAKHFAWTTAVCHRGLRRSVDLARLAGFAGDGVTLGGFAATMLRGFHASFVAGDGVVRGNLQTPDARALDLSAVEAFCGGQLDPRGPQFAAFRAACDARLKTAAGHGYKRNEDGTWYDDQEWVFCDLRMARALQLAGDDAAANALIDWVTAQAAANHQLIPELLTADMARYAGAIPMAGYGAGAYILALHPAFDPPPPAVLSRDRDD